MKQQHDIFPLSERGAAEIHLHTPFDLFDPFEVEKHNYRQGQDTEQGEQQ